MNTEKEATCPKCGKPESQCARNNNNLGTTLTEIRTEQNLTQQDVANASGLSLEDVQAFEQGTKRPVVENNELSNLGKALRTKPLDILSRSLKKSKLFQDIEE